MPAAGELITITDPLRLAVASYLARFKGQTRAHTESDLRCYLNWCAGHRLAPLTATRVHVELFVRWMQETRTLDVGSDTVPPPINGGCTVSPVGAPAMDGARSVPAYRGTRESHDCICRRYR